MTATMLVALKRQQGAESRTAEPQQRPASRGPAGSARAILAARNA